MVKRFVSFLSIFSLLTILLFPLQEAYAAVSKVTSDGHWEIKSNSTSINAGDRVVIKIYGRNVQTTGIETDIVYDSDIFEPLVSSNLSVSSGIGSDGVEYRFVGSLVGSAGSNFITVTSPLGNVVVVSGELATLTFTAKKSVRSASIGFHNFAHADENYAMVDYGNIALTISSNSSMGLPDTFASSNFQVHLTTFGILIALTISAYVFKKRYEKWKFLKKKME